MSGGIAHDFNNLLGVIIGYAEILQEKLVERDPLRGSADEIVKAGNRAASLTRQLLAFSRQQVLESEVLDLNEIVADIEKMLGKPVVNSNQAVLWGAVKRLNAKVGAIKPMPELGRLMASLNA